MAQRSVTIIALLGWGAVGMLAALLLAVFAAVGLRAEPSQGLGPADWAAIRFTVHQAALSSALSVGLGVPLARALSRRRFPGREMLITLLGAPFLLPVVVAAMGLIAIFGRNGWLNATLTSLGFETVSIYGFWGVVLAHVFFNLPLATRLFLQGYAEIPAAQYRLAAQLNLPKGPLFQVIDWPMLRRVAPGAASLIFVLCLTSFAVALMLGGGPRATTIELAIYQAFRFDFDLGRAALLSVVQLGLALVACTLLLRTMPDPVAFRSLSRAPQRLDRAPSDLPLIALGAVLLLAPLLSLLAAGIPDLPSLPASVWQAALRSLIVGLGSAAILLALALPIAALVVRHGGVELVGLMGLAISPLMIGTGLFLLLYPIANPSALALPVTALVNTMVALPFALRSLAPRLSDSLVSYGRLSASLGLTGWALWRVVLLPRLRAPIGFALGLGAALSIGDLGVIALFSDPNAPTLPLQIERLRGSYRTDQAAAASLVLAVMSFLVFWMFDRWGRAHA